MTIDYKAIAAHAANQSLRARIVQDWLINQAADELGDTALQEDLYYEWITLEYNVERIANLITRLHHKRHSRPLSSGDRNEVLARLFFEDRNETLRRLLDDDEAGPVT